MAVPEFIIDRLSLTMVFTQNSSILHWAVHQPIAFSGLWSLMRHFELVTGEIRLCVHYWLKNHWQGYLQTMSQQWMPKTLPVFNTVYIMI